MRHMSCDQIAHSTVRCRATALHSCFPDSSKAPEKSASSGVRAGSSRRLVLKHSYGLVLE